MVMGRWILCHPVSTRMIFKYEIIYHQTVTPPYRLGMNPNFHKINNIAIVIKTVRVLEYPGTGILKTAVGFRIA